MIEIRPVEKGHRRIATRAVSEREVMASGTAIYKNGDSRVPTMKEASAGSRRSRLWPSAGWTSYQVLEAEIVCSHKIKPNLDVPPALLITDGIRHPQFHSAVLDEPAITVETPRSSNGGIQTR